MRQTIKNKTLICIYGFLILIFGFQLVYSNDKMESSLFILSTGNELIELSLQDGVLKNSKNLLPSEKWKGVVWPAYDKNLEKIYFEAQNKDFGQVPHIFSISLVNNENVPEKVIEGRRPSISPDGSMLTYYRHPNQLWLLEIKNQTTTKIIQDILNSKPVVWISNQSFLYSNVKNEMKQMDVISGNIKILGHKYIIPGALSPDKSSVLCGSYDGKSIFLYTIYNNELSVLKKSIFFSMGSSFVWSIDGKSFLYTRQILSNQIKLIESQSLFLNSLEGKESEIIDRFSLFGGFAK